MFFEFPFQLGLWRILVQNVPVCARAQLYRIHIYSNDHLYGAIFCDYLSDYVQADTDTNQTTRNIFNTFFVQQFFLCVCAVCACVEQIEHRIHISHHT